MGVHVRFLFESSHYQKSPYQRLFTEMFGDGAWRSRPTEETGICALGIEASPWKKDRLNQLEACYRAKGWKVKFLVPAAITTKGNESVRFWTGDHLASNVFGNTRDFFHYLKKDDQEYNVSTVDLAEIVSVQCESGRVIELVSPESPSVAYRRV